MTITLVLAEVIVLLCGIVFGFTALRRGSFFFALSIVLWLVVVLTTQYQLGDALKALLPALAFSERVGLFIDAILGVIGWALGSGAARFFGRASPHKVSG